MSAICYCFGTTPQATRPLPPPFSGLSLRIVSRVQTDDSRPKLLKAGADAVVSNKSIGAMRLASEMLRPAVVSVLDAMLREQSKR